MAHLEASSQPWCPFPARCCAVAAVWQRCVYPLAQWLGLKPNFQKSFEQKAEQHGEGERGDAGVPGAAQDRGSVCFVSLPTLPTSTRAPCRSTPRRCVPQALQLLRSRRGELFLTCLLPAPLPPPSSLRSARRLTENILTLKPENPIGFMIGELMKRFPDATAGK